MEGAPELDETTIREFLAMDYRRLVAGLSLLAGTQAAAEDAVQEALARAWERTERGEHIESLKAWVTVVATNLLRSGLRRLLTERRARRNLTQPRSAAGSDYADERLDLERAMRALPHRQQRVTALYYFADASIVDIALALGTNEGAVKATLHRARRNLAERLSADYAEEASDHAGN